MHISIHIISCSCAYSSNMLLWFNHSIVLTHHTVPCIILSTTSSPRHMTKFIINSSRWFPYHILTWLIGWCWTICSWTTRTSSKSSLIWCEVHLLLLRSTLQQRASSSSRSSKILVVAAEAFLASQLSVTLKLARTSNIACCPTSKAALVIQYLIHCWRLAVSNLFLNLACFGSFRSWCLLLWLHCWYFVLLITTISIICRSDSLWCSLANLVIIIILLPLILISLCWWISKSAFHRNLFVFLFNRGLTIRLPILIGLILLLLCCL